MENFIIIIIIAINIIFIFLFFYLYYYYISFLRLTMNVQLMSVHTRHSLLVVLWSGPYLDFRRPYATLLPGALHNIIVWTPTQHYCFDVPTVPLRNIIVDNIIA